MSVVSSCRRAGNAADNASTACAGNGGAVITCITCDPKATEPTGTG